jgi:hypothetical protein
LIPYSSVDVVLAIPSCECSVQTFSEILAFKALFMWISRRLTSEGKIDEVTIMLDDFGEIDPRYRDHWF